MSEHRLSPVGLVLLDEALAEVERLRRARDPIVRRWLFHPLVQVGRAAVRALGDFGPDQAVELLCGMALTLRASPHLYPSFEAALLDARASRLLALLPLTDGDPAIATLCWFLRLVTGRQLQGLGPLTRAGGLAEQRATLRRLFRFSPRSLDAETAVKQAEKHPHPEARRAALDQLRRAPPPSSRALRNRIAQTAYDRMSDPAEAVRCAAAAWIARHEPDADAVLATHPDAEVRYAWFRAIRPTAERLADPAVVRLLARMLANDADPDGQEHAGRCLLHQDDARLLPLLLGHPSEAVRAAVAAEMVGGPWRAWWWPLALGLLRDSSVAVRSLAFRAAAAVPGVVSSSEEALRREGEAAAWEAAPATFAPDGEPTPATLLRARLWPAALATQEALRDLVRMAASADHPNAGGAVRLLEVLAPPILPALLRAEDVDGRVAVLLDAEPFPREADAPAEPLGVEEDGVAAVERYWRESFASPLSSRKLRALEYLEALLSQLHHPPLRRAMLEGTDADRRRVLRELV